MPIQGHDKQAEEQAPETISLGPSARSIAAEEVRSEIEEHLKVRQQQRRLFPRAAFVGHLAGLVATTFREIRHYG